MSHNPDKELTTGEGTTSKDKSISSSLNLSPIEEKTISTPSQGVAGDIHPLLTSESQLLQMFTDMKGEMVKQQALFDREPEQATYDRENAACEWEEVKRQNDQLFAQITTLQNTLGPPPSLEKLATTEAQNGEHSQSRRHRRTSSPTPLARSDGGSGSSHPCTRD